MKLFPQKRLRWTPILVGFYKISKNRLVLDGIVQVVVKNVKFETHSYDQRPYTKQALQGEKIRDIVWFLFFNLGSFCTFYHQFIIKCIRRYTKHKKHWCSRITSNYFSFCKKFVRPDRKHSKTCAWVTVFCFLFCFGVFFFIILGNLLRMHVKCIIWFRNSICFSY